MTKKIIMIITAGLIFVSAFILLFSNSKYSASSKTESVKKINVVVSFNAMREFAQAIGKDRIQITTIIPDGTEPHDFEPKARDLIEMNNAKVFVYNGLKMESWVDKAIGITDNKKLTLVDASKGFKQINASSESESGKYDPHVWLSLKGAEYEAKSILNALVKVDSSNKKFYVDNYNMFKNKLEKLFTIYNKKFKGLHNKNFVTGHAAFAYMCRDFGLNQKSVEGVFAEGEPSIKKLKSLIDYCRNNNIKTIFVEDMVSPRVSQTLASEVGGKAVKICTLESKEDNKDYIQSMTDNLEKIYSSLK